MTHEALSPPPSATETSTAEASVSATPAAPDLPEDSELDGLAHTIYRELYKAGYSRCDVVRFANRILGLVGSELREGVPLPPQARKVTPVR